MKKLSLYILIILIMISGCSNIGSTNNTEEPQITQTDITQTPGKETLGPTEPATPNSPTKTPEPVLLPWLEDKLDYDIDINNYDIKGEKQKYLLQVKLEYQVSEDDLDGTNYFVDVNEINQIEGYYEITGRSIIPEELEPYIQKISEDGKKVLLLYPDKNESTIEIFDLINRKVLYQYKINKEIPGVGATSDLEYLLIFGFGNMILLDVAKGTQKELDYSASLISPDGTKAVMYDPLEGGNITLKIYDLINEQIIDEINTGAKHINVFQWYESGKILFHTFEGSFYYDVKSKETKLIAPFFYRPIMSPDGKYVALTRDDRYGILDDTEIVEHGLYRQYGYEDGLYIKNMITNEIIQIAPFLESEYGLYNQISVQWVYVNKEFDNDKNRWCLPTEKEAEYTIYCSSVKEAYSSENMIDKNINTAWVEDEEHYNNISQGEKCDGKGIGEWIKIYKYTKAKVDYMKYEDYYRTDVEIGYMESFRLSGIKIINGYAKSRDIYFANNRVKKVEVILSDGSSYIFDLEDNNLGFQTLDFGKEIETRQVVIKILDIYEGSKYNDTCISEIELIEVAKDNQ